MFLKILIQKRKYLILFFVLLLSHAAYSQWQKIDSPKGIQVNNFYNSGDALYACSAQGVYQLNGSQWAKLSENLNFNVTSLVKLNNYLFAGISNDGIYRSNDNGGTWLKTINGLTTLYVQEVINYKGNVVVGTSYGLFLSNNNGLQWSNRNSNLVNTNIKAIIDYKDSLFVGTEYGIFTSSDTTKKWRARNVGLATNKNTTSFVDLGTKLAASFLGSGVYFSSDNAKTWTAVNTNLKNLNVKKLYFNNDTLYACTTDSLYYTNNLTTVQWKTIKTQSPSESYNSIAKFNNCVLLANSFGVYRYSNNKLVDLNTGFPNLTISKTFSIDTLLFVTTAKGMFQLDNKLNTWSYTTRFPNNSVLGIVPFDTSYLVYNATGLYVCNKKVNVWKKLSSKTNITCLATNLPNIYIGTNSEGVHRSTDKGTNWLPVNIGITGMNIKKILVVNSFLFALSDKLYKSDSNGDQWAGNGDAFTYNIVANKGNVIYKACTNNDAYYVLYKSIDYGSTWTTIMSYSSSINRVIYNPNSLSILGDYMFCFESGNINVSTSVDNIWYRGENGYTDKKPTVPGIKEIVFKDDAFYLTNTFNNIWKRVKSSFVFPQPPTNVKYKLYSTPNPSDSYVKGKITINWTNNSTTPTIGIRRYWDYADIFIPATSPSITFNIDTLSQSKDYFGKSFYLFANNNGDWSEFSSAVLDNSITNVNFTILSNNLKVYPNPVQSYLNINLDEGEMGLKAIRISNSTGSVVNIVYPNVNSCRIDFTKYPAGVYILDIVKSDNRSVKVKVLKD